MLATVSPLQKRDAFIALGLALLVLLAGSCRMAPGVCGSYHDDAIYVSTAQALASGQGYRLIDLPGAPLQTKYPILYPAALSAIWRIWPSFPHNVLAMQVVTLLSAAAFVALAYLYLVRFGYATRGIAAAAGAACATAPYFLCFAVQTMPEMPFALLSIASLWGVETFLQRGEMPRRSQFIWGIVLALPFLCRTIGVAVIVAGLWVLWRSRRPVQWYASGAALAAVPWVLWSLLGRGIWDQNPVDGYYTDYVGCWSSTGISMAGSVFFWNALMVVHGGAALSLEGISEFLELGIGRGYSCALLFVVGFAPWLAMTPDVRKGRALTAMLGAYLAVMLVWPWPPYRFLVPILPFLAAYLLAGWTSLMPRREIGWSWAQAAAFGLIVLTNGGLLALHCEQLGRTGYPQGKISDASVDWAAYARTFNWLKRNSRRQDVVASGFDSMVALYTDRRAFRPFVYDPGSLFYQGKSDLILPQELAAVLKRYQPRYFVRSPLPGFAEEKPLAAALDELRQLYPGWLVVSYQDDDPRFTVFELDWSFAPAAAEG